MTAELFQASYLQESLYCSAKGAQSAVNVGIALELHGPLDVPRLFAAFAALAERHEALRTTLDRVEGEVCQVVAPSGQVRPAVVDLSSEDDPEAEAVRLARDYLRRPFTLRGPALYRVMVIACRRDRHVLALSLHHSIIDGWSVGVLLADLRAAYQAAGRGPAAAAWTAEPLQPADYAAWERRPARRAELDGWRERLRGHSARLRVPGASAPGPEQLSLPCELPTADHGAAEGAERLARRLRVPVTAVLTAAIAASLGEYAADAGGLVIGIVRANRERAELRDVLGYLADVAPLPIALGGDPDFATLVGRAADAIAYSRDHPVPLGALAGLLHRPGDGPLFDVCLNYVPAQVTTSVRASAGEADGAPPMTWIELGDTEPAASRWWAGTALVDYALRSGGPGQLAGRVRGDLNTFPPELVTDWAAGFCSALLRGTSSPELPVSELAASVHGAAR
jgi:hypothetical protein